MHAAMVSPIGLRPKPDPNAERNARMAAMYRQGLTLMQIGEHFNVTRERVRQLLKSQGVTAQEGGASKRKNSREQGKSARREAVALSRWGMPSSQAKELRKSGVITFFERQRNAAHQRGVEWSLTLAQWWDVWQSSGKWELRGRGTGKYVMSRIKDIGGYAVGNVHIQLATENSREAVKKWRGKQKSHRGVFCLYPGTDRPYVAKLSGASIGRFASEQEASNARTACAEARGMRLTASGRWVSESLSHESSLHA